MKRICLAAAGLAMAAGLAAAPLRTARAGELNWLDDLEAAYPIARRSAGQILVRVGAEWCGWCEKLGEELDKPAVQSELKRFTLVYLDADKDGDAARKLGVGPIPALRILSPDGKIVARHDGYLAAAELIDWLGGEHAGVEKLPEILTASEPIDGPAARELLRELGRRETARREAAIRRLLPSPEAAATEVAKAFADGKLAVRLSALELLDAWDAPIDGLDPWRPETIDDERLKALARWAAAVVPPSADAPPGERLAPQSLPPDELAAARREIDKFVAAEAAEAEAIAARLARYGRALLPEVYARLEQAADDGQRERLVWLRYRLAATDALALEWPGGLARLASNDAAVRRQAAQELAARAAAADEPLLLELFGDADPLVREASLKALHSAGGERVSEALVRLLDDPEPNVRAAVLKQLAESPAASIVSTVAKYAAGEQDADLVVHAVRLLRATGGKPAAESLMKLLEHASWRVRAEAAEALGECVTSYQSPLSDGVKADVYVSLIDLLDDDDGFVVSRAMLGLQRADVPTMIDPLASAAEKRPELAAAAVEAMMNGQHARNKALSRLGAWTTRPEPELRAAALVGLCQAGEAGLGEILERGLTDDSPKVRIAAAQELFKKLDEQQPNANEPATDWETWLAEFRSAEGRPRWAAALLPALRKMLAADDAERLAAALALVPLVDDDEPLAALRALVEKNRNEIAAAAKALPWLPWQQRLAWFEELLGKTDDADALIVLAARLAQPGDLRADEPLWKLLAGEAVAAPLAASLVDDLKRLYRVGQAYYGNAQPPKPRLDVEKTKRFATAGGDWQRLAALALLLAFDRQAAAETARQIYDDAGQSDELRRDALQFLLLAQAAAEARETAIAALGSGAPAARRLGLAYLARGAEPLAAFEARGFHVDTSEPSRVYVSSGSQPVAAPEAPEGLQADDVRPFLADADGALAGFAGYLLALLGEPDGLEPLVKQWRAEGAASSTWTPLVYRAIAALDDADRADLLVEIYENIEHNAVDVREFYWTIRAMTGAESLQLRKRIRDEVGMDQLR